MADSPEGSHWVWIGLIVVMVILFGIGLGTGIIPPPELSKP